MKTPTLVVGSLLVVFSLGVGCSTSNTIIHVTGDGGSTDSDGGASSDGGTTDDGSTVADAGPLPDAGPPWDAGPLTCTTPGNYTKNFGGCGTERWLVKTGSDSQASAIALLPTPTTITALSALNGGKPYNNPPNSRISPVETKLVFLRDVTVVLVRLESDSDYHFGIQDQSFRTMIAEIPYPGGSGNCLDVGNPWACLISRARAAADAALMPTAAGKNPGVQATIVGVPFYDFPHGQTDEAPNGIELHPVLAICFGRGCTPM